MKKFRNKIITGFFVFVFGTAWFFSSKYYVKPKQYRVLVYDIKGVKMNPTDIRTSFSNEDVAFSYAKEYQKTHPDLKFAVEILIPEFKRRIFLLDKIKNYK
jgi:hypothetical protein